MEDKFYALSDRKFREVIDYYVEAQGNSHQSYHDDTGGPALTTDCQIHDANGRPMFETSTNQGRVPRTLIPTVLVHKDPLLLVRWAAPTTADPTPPLNGRTGFWDLSDAPGVYKTCQPSSGPPIAPSQPGEQLVTYDPGFAQDALDHQTLECGGKWLEPNPLTSHLGLGNDFWDVWSSDRELNTLGAVVRFSDLPYDRQFGFSGGISGPSGALTGQTCSQTVKYHSRVFFYSDLNLPCGDRRPEPVPIPERPHFVNPPPASGLPDVPPIAQKISFANGSSIESFPYCNKLGRLLVKDGLDILGGNPPGSGSDSIAKGEVTPLLFPGMAGTGTVTGQIISGATHSVDQRGATGDAHSAATQGHALYKARASVRADQPFTLLLKPTAAGRALLSAPHGQLTLDATATFTPAGRRQRRATASLTFTVPATT